ncbi:MAG: hypothetical protein EBW84_04460 [Betaproteobacteria bacterium]|nr:hypothetical protein [Betaproteobacteria bacterium]NDA05262.1 hypothetical protein [Betaproteobacteria bacterium]
MPIPIAAKFLAIARDIKSPDATPPATSASAPAKSADPAVKPAAPPTVAQVADKIMDRFDKNDDQAISAAELNAVLDPKDKFARIDKMVANLLDKVDSSDDGLISKSEWMTALNRLDKNGDGYLSRPDFHHGLDSLIALVGSLPHHEIPPGG